MILLGMLCEAYLRPLQESRSVRHCGSAEGSHFSLKSKKGWGIYLRRYSYDTIKLSVNPQYNFSKKLPFFFFPK